MCCVGNKSRVHVTFPSGNLPSSTLICPLANLLFKQRVLLPIRVGSNWNRGFFARFLISQSIGQLPVQLLSLTTFTTSYRLQILHCVGAVNYHIYWPWKVLFSIVTLLACVSSCCGVSAEDTKLEVMKVGVCGTPRLLFWYVLQINGKKRLPEKRAVALP